MAFGLGKPSPGQKQQSMSYFKTWKNAKFKQGHDSVKIHYIYSIVNQVISPKQHAKALAHTSSEISCLLSSVSTFKREAKLHNYMLEKKRENYGSAHFS